MVMCLRQGKLNEEVKMFERSNKPVLLQLLGLQVFNILLLTGVYFMFVVPTIDRINAGNCEVDIQKSAVITSKVEKTIFRGFSMEFADADSASAGWSSRVKLPSGMKTLEGYDFSGDVSIDVIRICDHQTEICTAYVSAYTADGRTWKGKLLDDVWSIEMVEGAARLMEEGLRVGRHGA
ncbi:hypothetical protein KTR10_02840 [Candidatus Kaiserbacteria bacterium]|nr:hypothetical protein [Candidatus Kaiserbacteria bacterium]